MDAKNSCISTLPVLILLMLSAFFIHSSAAVAIECQPLKFVPSTYSFSEDDDPYQDIPNVALKCTISETQERISVDLFSDDILKPYPYFDNQTMECYPNKMCDLDIYFECNNTQTRMDFESTNNQSRFILLAIRVENCVVGWSFLGTRVQLRVVESVMDDHSPIINPPSTSTELKGLQNLGALLLTCNQMKRTVNVHDLFPAGPGIMPNLSFLSLHCFLPDEQARNETHCRPRQIWFNATLLKQSFPKLQSFAFKRVYPRGDKPISFPWYPEKQPLSYGLYRSYYYRHLSYYTSNELNMTRRIFSVQRIKNLQVWLICPMQNELNEIVIRHCNLTSIPHTCFHKVTGLRYLDISFNPLKKVQSDLLANQTLLMKLYIRQTNLEYFPNGFFDDLASLDLLSISNNRLKYLQSHLFAKLMKLETLSIHDNQLNHVASNTLPRWSRVLRYVDLRYNLIETVPYDCHFMLNENSICNCDNNNITLANASEILQSFDPVRLNMAKPLAYNGQIPDILHESNLHEVDFTIMSLRNNKVKNVDVESYFSGNATSEWAQQAIAAVFSYVRMLLGTANPKDSLRCDCALYRFKQFVKYEMRPIVSKYIYTNLVLPNPEEAFDWVCQPYPILQYPSTYVARFMDMQPQNFICEVEKGEFDCPSKCTCYKRDNINQTIFVDCANRSLHEMPRFGTSLLPKGYNLDVSVAGNYITRFPECGANGYKWISVVTALNVNNNRAGGGHTNNSTLEQFLHCLTNVKKLYLDGTGLQHLPPTSIQTLTRNLTELEVPNDSLICDCNSYWLKGWLQKFNRTVKDYQYIYCGDKGKPIVQLEEKDFTCDGIAQTWPEIMVAVALFLAVVIFLGFAYHYRFELGVMIYEKLNWHPFDKQKEEQGKKYDAYLMYCDSDYRWAQNTLLAGLEKSRYRIVDPLRDSMPGRNTEEETAEFLTQSHRVIVVVSQKLLSDRKVMSDFYRAENQGKAYGNRRYIIMVEMHDKIKFGRHAVFLHYINTNYFIKATSKRFWPRLFYWLPQNRDSTILPAATENLPDFIERARDHADSTASIPRFVDEDEPSREMSEVTPLLNDGGLTG